MWPLILNPAGHWADAAFVSPQIYISWKEPKKWHVSNIALHKYYWQIIGEIIIIKHAYKCIYTDTHLLLKKHFYTVYQLIKIHWDF